MIRIGDTPLTLDDPQVLALLVAGLVLVVVLWLLVSTARAAARSARLTEPLAQQMGMLGHRVQSLSEGQERLSGGLHHVSEAQAQSQIKMLQLMEQRLGQVQQQMQENLHGSARRTARSLGELQERLSAIDKAQDLSLIHISEPTRPY